MKKILLFAFILLTLNTLQAQDTLLGIDLSYANEMNDCGAIFLENGQVKDVYQIFADHQANIVRLRLWPTPDSTNYSTFADVKRYIQVVGSSPGFTGDTLHLILYQSTSNENQTTQ